MHIQATVGLLAASILWPAVVLAQQIDRNTPASSLEFLVIGQTTRAKISEIFGEPSARFPADRIITYRLAPTAGGYRSVPRTFEWHPATHSLVLKFDERGVLVRYELINVRRLSP